MLPCILTAEILGGPPRRTSGSVSEAGHALERCRNRITLALESHGGSTVQRTASGLCARLPSADAAVLAACEMIERVYALPPVNGGAFGLRIGIRSIDSRGETLATAESARLASRALAATALLDATLAAALSASTRQFAQVSSVEHRDPSSALAAVLRHATLTGTDPMTRLHLRLRVRHQGHTLYVDAANPRLLLGREAGNDFVLDDPRASRHHARIDYRDNGFMLVDHSSNGSWMAAPGSHPVFVKDNEAALPGQGRIGCGQPGGPADIGLVDFEIH